MAMEHGKHLVMMNVEADVTIGAYLKQQADRLGVVYSVGAGDEPSSCMELIEFASALGYTIVSAGKGKNNPLNHDAVPDDYREEAMRRNMNPRMLVEFVDGSKTMVEMCAIANATGLVPDVPGMHGPKADRDEHGQGADPARGRRHPAEEGRRRLHHRQGRRAGRLRHRRGEHPRIIERMDDLHIGKGPYYSFFRPYHLTSLEVPLTAARIMLYGRPDMVPLPMPVAEVCAVAKRDLAVGETFDAIGETCYRSLTMTVAEARAAKRRAGRPARRRQGAGAGEEGRTADHRQRRARPDDQPLPPAQAAGRDAVRQSLTRRLGTGFGRSCSSDKLASWHCHDRCAILQ